MFISQSEFEQSAGFTTVNLQIYMLGPPRVELTGRSLAIPRRQARALLYRLAASLHPIPREQLCYLFWPDIPECEAHRHLTRLLTHLRRALPISEALLTSNDQAWLDSQWVWSDTRAFDRLHAALEVQDRIVARQQAVELYREPFLAGFSLPDSPEFETWVMLERQTRERLYLETLAILIEESTAKGEYEAAITYVQRYLATDELAEDMHRRLIELYAATGQRSASLRQFEYCNVILERELGVSPLPETRAAYQTTLASQAPLPRPMASPPAWTTLPSLEAPLVGRDGALYQLEQSYAHAQTGHGGVVLISGEPGIGKSRLMQEFVTRVAGQATVLVGSGHEGEQGLTYWPLVEAVGSHLQAINWSALDIEPLHLAELARLVPELQLLLPHLPTPVPLEPSQERGRLFQALVYCFLSFAAQYPPLVLAMDDLHWADEATLAWLGYLARRLEHAPVLILGAYRTEEIAAVAALRAELMRLGILQEVRLKGLLRLEVLRLLRYLSGQSSGAERFSYRLHRETGGNPFFLLETLRTLFEAGVLWQDETGWNTNLDETTEDYHELPLPHTLCEAIQVRLRRLDPQTQQVLEAGAAIGHRFSFDLVQATSGRSESEVVEALEVLLARQIIVEHDGKYRFNHDLIRAVVYHDLSYGRRRLLHRRAGEALEKLQPNNAAVLAKHFEQAEEPGRAAHYALQAGLAAKTVFAHAEARRYFDQALACLEQEAARLKEPEAITTNRRRQVQALAERGWAFRLLGDMEAYARDSQQVAQLAKLLGDQATLAHLRWREAYTHRWFCRYPAARETAEEGFRLSQAASDLLLEALCQREVGLAAREMGDYQQARVSLEQALRLFIDLDETVYEIHTLGNLSTLCHRLGEDERAINLGRQALARCEAAQLPLERRLPLGDMGAAAVAAGEVNLARQYLLESLAIARQIADCTQEIFCLGHLGWLCLKLRRPTQALEFLQAALALAENIGSSTEQSWLLSGLAEAHHQGNDLDLALEYISRALELAKISGRACDQELGYQILIKLEQTDK